MRIGFDRQTFMIQKYGGISRYFSDLYLGLQGKSGIEAELLFNSHQNAYLLEQGIGKPIGALAVEYYIKAMMRVNFSIPLAMNMDIHHSTYYLGRPKKAGNYPKLVTTLYDMIPELYPMFFGGNPHANKLDWFKASELIISISDSAADDLAFFQPELASRIKRIHLYAGFNATSAQRKPKRLESNKKPFTIFVGSRNGYKNAAMLIRAYANSEPKHHEHKLIFAGGGSFTNEEITYIRRLGIENYVEQLSVDDAELWYLYNNATAVLVPSLAEGFSLPLVEGLAANIPVICSDIPVHREVAGSFATLINPIHYDDWTEVMKRPTEMKSPKSILGEELYGDKCEYFEKERMIHEHIKAYESLR